MSGPRGLAAHVVHDVGAPRLERQWAAIARRTSAPRLRWQWAAWAAVVSLAFVLGVIGRRVGAPATVPNWEGTTFDTAGAESAVGLPGGARIVLAASTRASVAGWTEERVTIGLEQGKVTLDVPHVGGRDWVVAAGPYDVRVVGTRFSVRRDGDRVQVDVERGRVEVRDTRDAGEARALSAGESWSVDATAAAAISGSPLAPAASSSSAAAVPPAADASARAASSSAAARASAAAPAAPVVAAAPPIPEWEEHAKARRYKQAYEALGAEGVSRAIDGGSVDQLMRVAEVSRGSGHLRDAARAFDTIRKRHRGDPRAGLAAFELGRLRLDALGSPAGAAEALSDAIALAPGAPFRQDAEARRVQALHASGSTAACVQARDAYLARYPSGTHAAVVRSRCGGGER